MPSFVSNDAEQKIVTRLDRIRKTWQHQGLTRSVVRSFRRIVHHAYDGAGRILPWRKDPTPYKVVVSEIMLQQTQVDRVARLFPPFIDAFPDFGSLATAPFEEVLRKWRGLGYHRRARALHDLAHQVENDYQGSLPQDTTLLRSLPGLGPATSCSVAVFAFNHPHAFIETNIRALFIYMAFSHEESIDDKTILPMVETTMDLENPSRWFNALMDVGALIKRLRHNAARRSKHYTRQSTFEGSRRQLRARILHLLVDKGAMTTATLANHLRLSAESIEPLLDGLVRERFVKRDSARHLTIVR